VQERFAGRVTRLSFYAAYPVAASVWDELLTAVRG
jgi:hypothetical protein